jgi:hypothetical protein
MKAKHTPGPWHTTGDGLVYAEPSFDDIEAPFICDATDDSQWRAPNDEEKANAQLISAAPELLEALILLLNVEKAALIGAKAPGLKGLDVPYHFEAARAAIARATMEN